jgi:Response regulator containing CheY-like receiver domain and AraC-type DNA-binding domain
MYRIMIVDDEPFIRKGLQNFIRWDEIDCEIVCEADNGIDAQNKLSAFLPDIIISDIKMPGLNGIALSKFVYENYSEIKVILLTGYSDFSYAQAAVKYGVVDFVLKPTSTEDILAAVCKAKALISQKKEQDIKMSTLENKISINYSDITEKFFQDIINGTLIDTKTISDKLLTLGISLKSYYTIVYEINNFKNKDTLTTPEEVNRFILAVKNLLSLGFKDNTHYNIFLNSHLLCTIICFNNEEDSECMQKILLKCEEILDLVRNFMNFSIAIGISNAHSTVSQIPAAYNEAMKSLANKFYSDGNIFIYSDYLTNQTQIEENVIDNYIEKIKLYIQEGNYDDAIITLKELLEKQKSFKQPIDYIMNTSILICSECSKLLANHNLSLTKIMGDSDDLYKQILQSKTMDSLALLLTEILKSSSQFFSSTQRQNNYIIRKTTEYIKDHYTQTIKLQLIAEHVHVNSSYLSRLFRKETGETITDAIARFRIEKAKELLANTNIKAYEVASMVGIEDSAYFSLLFKKITGLSPLKYKNNL